ncbi:hypothetical protein SAMN05216201_10937 [Pseudomonas linyingensis]|uniref:Heme utilization protein n=1 Tax=Pseudomonas linyingensis TaxID=915471 RepID=A0A1H6YWJ1_9PSED|nr:hypothetical protein [Pseudomonas linyingensis]MCM2319144.1 hypothetical protein [Pseudomonas sp.]SEJ45629.1 hypothetical protein SAMN05216201_10937 [Pseudomonas linyingensis]
MKASMTLKPLVFAMAAAMAMAAQANQYHGRHHHDRNPLLDRSAGDATAYAGRDQYIGNATVTNQGTENSATIEDSLSSSGNIGANVAAGDMNQQANNVAVATADEQFVFGSAEADASIDQWSDARAYNMGGGSAAMMDGSGNDASGNIGVNVASGSLNQQQNALAIATARGWDADADATGEQWLEGNVENKAASYTVEKTFAVTKDWDNSYSREESSDESHSWDASWQAQSAKSATASASLSASYDSSSSSDRTYSASVDASMEANRSRSASAEWDRSLTVDASIDGELEIERERRRGEVEFEIEGELTVDVDASASGSMSQESSASADFTKSVDAESSYTANDSHSVDKSFEAEYSKTHEASASASAEKNETHEANSSIEEVGSHSLAASVTFTKSVTFANPVVNSATLSNSLNDVDGNIGVNMAAGSGNQQLNTLAIAVGCDACNTGN